MYDLRHTVATLVLANDVNVEFVSERLGHESVEITPRHYAHVLPSLQAKAASTIERLFGDRPTGAKRGMQENSAITDN